MDRRHLDATRVDLHLHTTHSDGVCTPAQVIDLARRSGLVAVALTDHDTWAGLDEARSAAGAVLEVVPGVEISAEDGGREFHLLGYFFRPDPALTAALQRLRAHRVDRFWDMVERLRGCGVSLEEEAVRAVLGSPSLGRRHLAALLVQTRQAETVRQAFDRYLADDGRVAAPKVRLPVDEAIALVRGAGGVAAWAHPPYDCLLPTLTDLHARGLQAVEVEFPGCRPGRSRQLRQWAAAVGLAVTGGSDYHGPGEGRREVGSRSITAGELETIRDLAGGTV
jgi:predicted metal-dependent phosphoesterase TrpH